MRLHLSLQGDSRLDCSAISFGAEGGHIGRSPGNDWVLPDPSRAVSGVHAEIHHIDNAFVIRDVSTNGLFINGADRPLGAERTHRLAEGDQLRIGEYLVLVAVDHDFGLEARDNISGQNLAYPPLPHPSAARIDDLPPENGLGLFAPSAKASDPLAGLEEPSVQTAPPIDAIPDDWSFDASQPVAVPEPVQPPRPAPPQPQPAPPLAAQPVAVPEPVQPPRPAPPQPQPAPPLAAQPVAVPEPVQPPRPAPPQPQPAPPLAAIPVAVPEPIQPPRPAPPQPQPAPPLAAIPVAIPEPIQPPQPAPPQPQPAPPLAAIPVAVPEPVQPPRPAPPQPQPAPPLAAIPVAIPEPVQPPQPAPPQPQPPQPAHGLPCEALWLGMGVSMSPEADLPALLGSVGRALRILADGMVTLMSARRLLKRELRLQPAFGREAGENSFQAAPTGSDALRLSLAGPAAGFMPLDVAINHSLIEIKAHEAAMISAVRAAQAGLIERFDPSILARRLNGPIGQGSLERLFAWVFPNRLWARYCRQFNVIAAEATETFQEILAEELARAYGAHLGVLSGYGPLERQRVGTVPSAVSPGEKPRDPLWTGWIEGSHVLR